METVSPFRITLALFDGFSNMVLASALEPLRAANDLSGRPLFAWRLASVTGGPALSSSGLPVAADCALSAIGATDALIVVAGYGMRAAATRPVLSAIRRAARRAGLVAGHDTGAWLLAEAGLLDGCRATLHWMEQVEFQERFATVELAPGLYVQDGNRVTTGTAAGAMSLALDLIGQRAGKALRLDVGHMFDDAFRDGAGDGQLSRDAFAGPVGRAVLLMHKTLEAPLPLAEIAAHAAVSERTLERLFRRALGLSAGQYYRNLRLSRAQFLARNGGLTLAEIAVRTGFSSAPTLARAYRSHFGTPVGTGRRGGGA